MAKKSIEGIVTLTPTVFDENREPDIEGFKENLRYLDQETGMHGVVFGASVGEYYQLNRKEWMTYASAARDVVSRMVLLCGSHWQNTRECVARSKYADDICADALFILPPYYADWTTEEGVYQHYKAVHDATSKIQIMAYNMIHLAGINILPDLFGRLLKDFPRITAVKECHTNYQFTELIRRYGDRFNVLAGAELGLYQTMFLGGQGSVAVWGSAIPNFLVNFYNYCKEKKWEKALECHQLLIEHSYAARSSYADPSYSLGGIKTLVEEAGHNAGPMREPFLKANLKTREFHSKWIKKVHRKWLQQEAEKK
jgi:4-hydroxy-tetrahydrodipicolinate synthase